jgi:hypothetical protein
MTDQNWMPSLAPLLVVMELVQIAWVHQLRAGIPSVDEQEVAGSSGRQM